MEEHWLINKTDKVAVVFKIKPYKGKLRLDIREHFLRDAESNEDEGFIHASKDKVWQFTGKGVSFNLEGIDVDELSKTLKLVAEALDKT